MRDLRLDYFDESKYRLNHVTVEYITFFERVIVNLTVSKWISQQVGVKVKLSVVKPLCSVIGEAK